MEISRLTKLSVTELSGNNFSSPVPKFFANFSNLISLGLSDCNLVGNFPEEIFRIPSLQTLDLSRNRLLGGSLPDFSQGGSLRSLYLSQTNFSGPLPNSFANLSQLVHLDLSSNTFTGPIPTPCVEGLEKLVSIDLSYNSFTGSIPSSLFNHSSLQEIILTHNHFDGLLPKFSNGSSSQLDTLELGSNFLQGPIPMPFFDLSNLREFSLSSNNLSGTIELIAFQKIANLTTLDLSYNSLSIETSSNKSSFSKAFPWLFSLNLASCKLKTFPDFRNQSRLLSIDFSDNQIGGDIPSWIWDLNLADLNLSHNFLVNLQKPFSIPTDLRVLDLNSNDLHGEIPKPPERPVYVDYSSNHFSSSIRNLIDGTLPCWLNNLSNLRVLVLRSNWFQGNLHCLEANQSWKNLQIIDLASNNFSGILPTKGFLNFKAMMVDEEELKGESNPLLFECFRLSRLCYQDKVKLVGKGVQMELVTILTIYTFIDLSSNMFQGNVPEEMGHLTSLYVLNLSNNSLTGQIPSSFGSLKVLESLDLSKNKLHGIIPSQLGGLTFLSFLNLSFHQLEGMIPKGSQFQTFTEASFQGNKGLCGFPLNAKCQDSGVPGSSPPAYENVHYGSKIEWDLIAAEIGFAFGLGIFVVLLVFCKKWRKYYYEHVDQFLSRIFNMQRQENGRGERRRGRKIQRRSI